MKITLVFVYFQRKHRVDRLVVHVIIIVYDITTLISTHPVTIYVTS